MIPPVPVPGHVPVPVPVPVPELEPVPALVDISRLLPSIRMMILQDAIHSPTSFLKLNVAIVTRVSFPYSQPATVITQSALQARLRLLLASCLPSSYRKAKIRKQDA